MLVSSALAKRCRYLGSKFWYKKQEFIRLLDRINAPSYVDLMISLLCKAVNNIAPYEDDQYNTVRYRKIYDLYGTNGTAHFKKCKQLFEYQCLLLLRDIWR